MSDKARADIKGLKNLVNLLQKGLPRIKVGVLGETNQRNTEGPTNAEIGFANEFGKMTGYPKIPSRSFIRMPLNLHFRKNLKGKKSLTGKELEKALVSGKEKEFAQKVGLVAEETIQEAFETHGFGNWAPNAPRTIADKGSDSPLIDTGQLRRSITSKVIK